MIKKYPLPKIVIIVIGCVGLLIIGSVIFSKFSLNFVKKAVETKSGAEINVGEGTIPAGFPKDFPLYPGAKIEGNISGAENKAGKGYWLMLSTTDAGDKTSSWYEENLPKNGWTVLNTMTIGPSSTWQVEKGDLEGNVIVGANEEKDETSIVITLSPKEEK